MDNLVTCGKIGTGIDDDPIRPNTNALAWIVVEERDDEFDIQILNVIN